VHVVDAEPNAMGVENGQSFERVPALLPEFEDIAEVRCENLQKFLKPFQVNFQAGRKLNRIGPSAAPKSRVGESIRSSGSAQSFSFLAWVMKRFAFTA
jgi:hypothetical protein